MELIYIYIYIIFSCPYINGYCIFDRAVLEEIKCLVVLFSLLYFMTVPFWEKSNSWSCHFRYFIIDRAILGAIKYFGRAIFVSV